MADSGSMVAWMPAGRSLLVRDGSPEEGTPYGIFQIDRETSKRNQVTHAPSGIGDSAFDVSPDGRSLAFVRYERPGIGDVYVALIAGRDAHRRPNWNTEISGVAWTPDGCDLVYAVLEEPGLDPTVFRIPASGNRLDRGVRSISRDRSRAECSSVFADSRTRRAWTCRDRSRKTGSASHSARTATAGPGCGWPTATGPEFNR